MTEMLASVLAGASPNKDVSRFHRLSKELDDCVTQLQLYTEILTQDQVSRLRDLVKEVAGENALNVSEVDRQYHLLLKMQKSVIDNDGNLLEGNTLKEMATLVSAMNSVMSLYLKARKDMDGMRSESDLKQAVLLALEELPAESRAKFFKALERFQGGH